MEINELKQTLCDRTESVVKMLLPAGIKASGEWKVGSVGGDKGESLSVNLRGAKAGIWADFATGQAGDLIDLWCEVRGQNLSAALEDIRDYLGVEKPTFQKPKRETFTLPQKPACRKPSGEVLEYLIGRGLTEDTLVAYKIAEQGSNIIFPFLRDGVLHLAKSRNIHNGKPKPTESNCRPILFGWQAIPKDSREIIITEGEIDACTMYQYGFPSVSVPFGGGTGGKHNWIDHDYHYLDRFETIYLCMDMDGPGMDAAQDISDRLGKHRCKIVELPKKDANECLKSGLSTEVIQKCIQDAKYIEPEELVSASDFYNEVHATFHPNETEGGYTVPWDGFKDKVSFRPNETTLWTGASGAGKSQLLSHAIVHMMDDGAKVCLASLEMTPAQSLKRMVKQAGDVDSPTDEFLKDTLDWMGGKLWIFNLVGKERIDRLLDVFEYARRRYGVDTFVIDSFMRLGIGVDDYKAQDQAIFQLTDWAVTRPVHLHLVAHARKSQDPKAPPVTEDVKGTSEIGSNAFNIISVWRDRNVEENLEAAFINGDEEEQRKFSSIPGVSITVAKQRNGDYEGKQGVFFDSRNYRYFSKKRDSRRYVNKGVLPNVQNL